MIDYLNPGDCLAGLKETPEQLASLVEQIISKGLRMFQPEAGL